MPMTHTDLGNIVLSAVGEDACLSGYGTDDPEMVGWFALAYGDIDVDGTLN